ncbi:MAG: helix-turn-helix domain-containing protein [Geminicoccaceae bacterium]
MAGAISGGTHLEPEERERLAASKAEGLSPRAIAARLGRAASTVSRELRRDALPNAPTCRPAPRAATWSAGSGRPSSSATSASAASCASARSRAGRRGGSPAG